MGNKKSTNVVFGFIAIVLATCITLQVRTMKLSTSDVVQSFASDKLRDSLLQWKENYENAEATLTESTKQLAEIRKNVASKTSDTEEMNAELKRNNMLLGLTKVKGDGLVVTIEDSKAATQIEDVSIFLVHDSDLRELVNEFANAGAEAIEINGERIVSNTCITCAGNVISVNGTRISSPFVIKGIGNQESLYGALTRPGGYIQLLKNQTIPTEVKKTKDIEIDKFSGAMKIEYMKPIE